jgi:hypothetical protein
MVCGGVAGGGGCVTPRLSTSFPPMSRVLRGLYPFFSAIKSNLIKRYIDLYCKRHCLQTVF